MAKKASKSTLTNTAKTLKQLNKPANIRKAMAAADRPLPEFLTRSPKDMNVRRNDNNQLNRAMHDVRIIDQGPRKYTIDMPAPKAKKPLSPKRLLEFRKGDYNRLISR